VEGKKQPIRKANGNFHPKQNRCCNGLELLEINRKERSRQRLFHRLGTSKTRRFWKRDASCVRAQSRASKQKQQKKQKQGHQVAAKAEASTKQHKCCNGQKSFDLKETTEAGKSFPKGLEPAGKEDFEKRMLLVSELCQEQASKSKRSRSLDTRQQQKQKQVQSMDGRYNSQKLEKQIFSSKSPQPQPFMQHFPK